MSDAERRLRNEIRNLRADKTRLQSEVAVLTDALASATRRRRRPSKSKEVEMILTDGNGPATPAQPNGPASPGNPTPDGEGTGA
jgi:hypothetical protein